MTIRIEDMDGDDGDLRIEKHYENRFHFTIDGSTVACNKSDAIRIVELLTGDSQHDAAVAATEPPSDACLPYHNRVQLAFEIYQMGSVSAEDAVGRAKVILEGMR